MDRFVSAIISMVQAARFHPVPAVLPPDAWFVLPGRFRFGLPWPWRQHTDIDGELVDYTGQRSERAPLLGLASAPRTSGDARLGLWRGDEPLEPHLSDVAGYTRQLYRNPPRSVRRIRLAGVKAIVIEVDTANGQRVHRLIAGWGPNHTLHGELWTPANTADGYRPHLDTMLATWQWG